MTRTFVFSSFVSDPLKFGPTVTDSCTLTSASLEEAWFSLSELSNARGKIQENCRQSRSDVPCVEISQQKVGSDYDKEQSSDRD